MGPLIFSHPACLEHDVHPDHPERPDRLRAVLAALEAEEFAGLEWRQAPRASLEQIGRVHGAGYVEAVIAAEPEQGVVQLDPDTGIAKGSIEAALRAAGALCAAVDAVANGEAESAFCAVRPPGHHAEADRSMGFCLFNNVAVGALHGRAAHGLERVAVIDFDVHHGNGTQHSLEADERLFYGSSHQYPHYPGTGAESETGVAGNVVNVALAPGSGSAAFRAGMEERVLPALSDFGPDLIMISAGFDGHADDPLAEIDLYEDDFAWITSRLVEIAGEACSGRIVSTLEGGYNLDALAASCAAHVRALGGG